MRTAEPTFSCRSGNFNSIKNSHKAERSGKQQGLAERSVITPAHNGRVGWNRQRDLSPNRRWEKHRRPTSPQEAVTNHFTIKMCWGWVGLSEVRGSKCLRSHSSSSRQGERKHRAKRISPNPCWFFLFFGLKRGAIGAKRPSWPPKEHYAISVWLSGASGPFALLKGFLFRDEILMIRVRQQHVSAHLRHTDECFQSKSGLSSKSLLYDEAPSIPTEQQSVQPVVNRHSPAAKNHQPTST